MLKAETKITHESDLGEALDNLTKDEIIDVITMLDKNNEDIENLGLTRHILIGIYYLTIDYTKEPDSVFIRNKEIKKELLELIE